MAINRQFIGYQLPSFDVTVEKERLQEFAAAIRAAPAACNDVRALPTFLKVIEGEHGSSRKIMSALEIPLELVMHAEQTFEYHAPYQAGDRLVVERSVSDIYERKAGALEFVVLATVIRKAGGELIARTSQLIVVRNPSTGSA